ncbi:MepB family protein [Gillisia hiemivivida]|uniref:MepB family protein n=1 Tax=Gillisia hiemivivida TaxID=291190 RepID=A0A5C6ZSF5_9FLAO|nr:MepB family protein [Gillisia hiemivivida]TXD91603.1 MepB family protein [Gillisia hiemivivida]
MVSKILEFYKKCSLIITDFRLEKESKKYDACNFKLNDLSIICRKSKITAKKAGQFVTFWKRNDSGIIEPFQENDDFDFFVVNVKSTHLFGQFVFPKSELINQKIISTEKQEGKRAFRVYPSWDLPESKQAELTQKWQLNYFYEVSDSTSLTKVADLYETK